MEYILLSSTGKEEKVSIIVINKSKVWSTAISKQWLPTNHISTDLSDNDLVYIINLLETEPYTYEEITKIFNRAPLLSQVISVREIADKYDIESLISIIDQYLPNRIKYDLPKVSSEMSKLQGMLYPVLDTITGEGPEVIGIFKTKLEAYNYMLKYAEKILRDRNDMNLDEFLRNIVEYSPDVDLFMDISEGAEPRQIIIQEFNVENS